MNVTCITQKWLNQNDFKFGMIVEKYTTIKIRMYLMCIFNVQLVQSLDMLVHEGNRN